MTTTKGSSGKENNSKSFTRLYQQRSPHKLHNGRSKIDIDH